ncbi:MAG TPA: hypothetical protein VLJ37_12535 [bacterium]|nr:hypothetical protein [bacterium]
MKKILKTLFLLAAGFLFLIPSFSSVGGCSSGASAPPASIPAPVSSLISLTPPDDTGLIVVTGDVGSVEPGATVIAANVTKGGVVFRWEDLFIRSAFAQVFEATTTADDAGRFVLNIDGDSGDQIGIRQQVGTEQSDVTFVVVP